jgi:hypothetical protein
VIRALTILALSLWSTSASASWVDQFGREISFTFPGHAPVTLSKGNHTLADGIAAFDAVCLKTGFDKSAVEKAIQALSWGFTYKAETFPLTNAVDIGGWNTDDATVRVGIDLFFNKKAQCSVVVMTSDTPTADGMVDGLTAIIGKAPENAKKRYDKQGKPYPYFSPKWTVVNASGQSTTIYAQWSITSAGAVVFAVVGK